MSCTVCGSRIGRDSPSQWVDGYELARCESCGLIFRRLLPTNDDLISLYDTSYFRDELGDTGGYADYLADESLHRSLARRRLAWIEVNVPPPKRLLDVGAAAGFFVAEAIERGWDAQGLDVSPAMVAHATDVVRVPVAFGTLEKIDGESYDAITMWDYIEHALDPGSDIERSASLLRPGGVLAISTGDADSLAARVCRSRWHLLTPRHHNFFFSATTIRRLLESRGFEILRLSHPGARYSMSHIVYKLGEVVPGTSLTRLAQHIARSPLDKTSLPVNLFDIVTVIARRPS